ncbi:MAG: hypothetical protein IPI77_18185 [Saprospiraceae bacterium]|nr:hypothetical protein [Saprospiraceae bacterium]
MVIVAPTGVAAINAEGVTIHSFFQLPFGPFIPAANGTAEKRFEHNSVKKNQGYQSNGSAGHRRNQYGPRIYWTPSMRYCDDTGCEISLLTGCTDY